MTLVSKLAGEVSRHFLPSDNARIRERLRWLRDSGLTYRTNENPMLSQAVQAAEDRSFYRHSGFHVRGILRAGYVYITKRQLQGASTIEQQLVRVVRARYEVTIGRKISEVILATALATEFQKDSILEMYMEVAYFGWHGTGIREICQRLELEPNSMSLSDACLIAALIKMPLPRIPSATCKTKLKDRSDYVRRNLRQSRSER